MASIGSFMDGTAVAIIGIIFTLILFFAIALPTEQYVAEMETGGYYDQPEAWNSYDDIVYWMDLMYIVVVLPALVGIITMFLSAIKTQEQDVVVDELPPAQQQYVINSRYGEYR